MKRAKYEIGDYARTVKDRLDMISEIDGKQPGDPKLAAKIVMDLAQHPNPPHQLLLGKGVLKNYREKLDEVIFSLNEWEEVTLSTEYPSIT